MKRDSVDNKRTKRYAIALIAIVMIIAIDVVYNGNPFQRCTIITRFEKIEIRNVSVSKSQHTYFIYINFINAGTASTTIDSVSLNDVPYDDSGWVGTIKPTIFGNLTSGTFIRSEGITDPLGIIYFSDDCVHIPSEGRLTAGVTVTITIHTTGGKDYDTSLTLP
jgi:hypothetical protein